MRAAFSLPLLGAALITTGAIVLRLVRISARVPALPLPSVSLPLSDPKPLPERLRERGF